MAKLATLSDGTLFESVNSVKACQKKLAKLQCEMSRKVTSSNNWKKAKYQVQNLHARIANIRRDYLRKVSMTISKNHAMIVIEDLKVANMSKSAAGHAALACGEMAALGRSMKQEPTEVSQASV